MPDFADLALEYEKIKKTPEVIDSLRVKENPNGNPADALQKRQRMLPDAKAHYKLQEKYTTMFDKSSRAGAKSKVGGLILPSGRKIFSEFHDNFTGTGRFKPQKAPDKVQLPEKAIKVDTKGPSVVLYERCMDCLERVDRDHCVPNMTFLPNGENMNEIARSKWQSVQITPGAVLCYLFCDKCPTEAAKHVKQILHDPFKSQLIIGIVDGKPMTMAEKESKEYMAARGQRIEDNVFQQVKYHRDLPDSDIFYNEAKLK